jgi:tRNA pseudouridine55 synthase
MIILPETFTQGTHLLIDKPIQWTSFDVVNYLRVELKRKIGLKEIKIGHAGTLDPLATGLVIVCTGKWTKKINEFQDMDKEYIGQITIGSTTPSFDLESEIDATFPTEHITKDMISVAAQSFLGISDQLPPIFSAKKIKGKRAYEYARQGEEVVMKPKQVHIKAFDITLIEDNVITFRIQCSKGTYIRSIARDLGVKLQSGGHLSKLRRTTIGTYLVVDAMTPAEFSLMLNEHLYDI